MDLQQLATAAAAILLISMIVSAVIGIIYRSVKACLGCLAAAITAVIVTALVLYLWQTGFQYRLFR
jgi:hypothetical protein